MPPIDLPAHHPTEVEALLGSIIVPTPTASLEVRLANVLEACSAHPTQHRHRRRTVLVFAGATALAVVAAGGVAASVVWRAPTQRSTITCFATPSVDGPPGQNSFDAAMATGTDGAGSDAASLALSLCSAAWERGELRPEPPYVVPVDPDAPYESQPVPSLIACILPSGGVGVIPGEQGACELVGLPEALPA